MNAFISSIGLRKLRITFTTFKLDNEMVDCLSLLTVQPLTLLLEGDIQVSTYDIFLPSGTLDSIFLKHPDTDSNLPNLKIIN